MKNGVLKRLALSAVAVVSGMIMAGSQSIVADAAIILPANQASVINLSQSQAAQAAALLQSQQAAALLQSQQAAALAQAQQAAMMQAQQAVQAPAASANKALLLVYNDQEGRGYIKECTINGRPFKYTTECNVGDYVVVKLEVHPGDNTFDGWYINGERVSVNKDYSFTVKSPTVVCEARMCQTYGYCGTYNDGVVTYNWANQVIRFAPGHGRYDMAVTTRFMGSGANLAAACAPVIGTGRVVRSYNVTCTRNNGDLTVTQFDSPQNFVFKIPTELQAPGRVFKMVLVRNGVPYVCDDLDGSNETVTFATQYPGTFALVQY